MAKYLFLMLVIACHSYAQNSDLQKALTAAQMGKGVNVCDRIFQLKIERTLLICHVPYG